jgi:hypothetical protein
MFDGSGGEGSQPGEPSASVERLYAKKEWEKLERYRARLAGALDLNAI